MTTRLRELCDEAEDMGIGEPMAEVVAAYLDAVQKAESACVDFRWGDPCTGGELINIPAPPMVLVEIGPLIEITYESTKRGELAHWVHAFEAERPVLAYDDMTGGQLYIIGGGYKVTPRGIVG